MDVSIRPYRLDDAGHLFEAARESTAEVFPSLPWCHADYKIEEAREWIAKQVESFEQLSEFEFVIESPEGRFLGGCGLNLINSMHLCANLGYWVRSSAAGHGVASAAVRVLARWAFANTDLERLEILTVVENVRSQRVAEKAGAQREGVARSRLRLHDRSHDAVVYSIVRPDHRPLDLGRINARPARS